MDAIDRRLVTELAYDGALTVVELAPLVGLSASACTRRLQRLREAGVLAGMRALVDPGSVGLGLAVFVEIALDRQNSDALAAFESALRRCPNVISCHLMAGSVDYLVHLRVDDLTDFERLHTEVLGRLPGVSRIESRFSLRQVIDRPVAPLGTG